MTTRTHVQAGGEALFPTGVTWLRFFRHFGDPASRSEEPLPQQVQFGASIHRLRYPRVEGAGVSLPNHVGKGCCERTQGSQRGILAQLGDHGRLGIS